MIEMRRAQLSFGDGLIAEEVSDLREGAQNAGLLHRSERFNVLRPANENRGPRNRSRGGEAHVSLYLWPRRSCRARFCFSTLSRRRRCRDIVDGHRTTYDMRGDGYWVPIEGAWQHVPPEPVVHNAGNPGSPWL